MCKWGKTRNVLVKIPPDLSATGFAKMQFKPIDECVAPIVEALQKGCVDTRGSCCGHGKAFGEIRLQDGRMLIIVPEKWHNQGGALMLQNIFDKLKKSDKRKSL